MTKPSDDIIILSDDDEDDPKTKAVASSKRPKPIDKPLATRTSTTTTSRTPIKTRAPVLILTEPKSISYGIERGYKLKHIHGVTRLKSDNQLMYLVEYELCDDYEFVPSNILRRYCDENSLIKYLEKLTHFTN